MNYTPKFRILIFCFFVVVKSYGQTFSESDVFRTSDFVRLAPSENQWTKLKSEDFRKSINGAEFVDNKLWWIYSRHSIFKTENGGRTWDEHQIKVNESLEISQLYFFNKRHGLLLLNRTEQQLGRASQSKLLRTEDGGFNWQEIRNTYSTDVVKFVVLRQLNRIILFGRKFNGSPPIANSPLIQFSDDAGKTWKDNSDCFADGKNNDFPVGISSVKGQTLEIISYHGRLLRSSTSFENCKWGRNVKDWNATDFVIPQFDFYKYFGIDGVNYWMIATRNAHGAFSSNFAAKRNREGWYLRRINNFEVYGAWSVDRLGIIACGGEYLNKLGVKEISEPIGVLLESRDLGLNWDKIYEKPNSVIVAAKKVSKYRYFIAEASGEVYFIEKSES